MALENIFFLAAFHLSGKKFQIKKKNSNIPSVSEELISFVKHAVRIYVVVLKYHNLHNVQCLFVSVQRIAQKASEFPLDYHIGRFVMTVAALLRSRLLS